MLGLVLLLTLAAGAPPGSAVVGAQTPPFEWVDDRGDQVAGALEVCVVVELEQRCETVSAEDPYHWRLGSELRVESERYGPVRLTRRDLGLAERRPVVVVPRKAELYLAGLGSQGASVSLYDLADPLLRRPVERFDVELENDGTARVGVRPGEALLSVTQAGSAPDLHLLSTAPGRRSRVRVERRPGWSAVLRAVDRSSGEGVAGAAVTIEDGVEVDQGGRRWSTRTDERGWSVVSGITAALAGATMEHPGYLPAVAPGLAATPGTFAVREIELSHGARLEVLVTVEGEPRVGVRWRLTAVEGRADAAATRGAVAASGETSEAGTLEVERLRPGHYLLALEPSEESRGVALRALQLLDGETERVEVELEAIRVTGTVRRGKAPAVDFGVMVFPTDAAVGSSVVDEAASGVTDEEGAFEVTVWQPGEHVVSVRTPAGGPAGSRFVELIGPDEVVDFSLPEHSIVGRVVDDEGEPVASARIMLSGDFERGGNVMRMAEADDHGLFEVVWDREGTVQLQALKEGFAPSPKVRVTVSEAAPPPPVELVLEGRPALVGRVVGPTGAGVAGTRVWKVVDGEVPRVVGEAVTGPDGGFEIGGDAAGERGPLWVSGLGCPLVVVAAPPAGEPVEVHCSTAPGVLIVRMTSAAPGVPLAGRSLLLKQETSSQGPAVVPEEILRLHLAALGLPAASDGTGTLVLALAPGSYELYLAGASSSESIARGLPHGFLGRVTVDPGVTSEVEVVERETDL